MSTVEVKNIKNEKVGEVELNDQVFNREVKNYVLHDVVRQQRAARRPVHKQVFRNDVDDVPIVEAPREQLPPDAQVGQIVTAQDEQGRQFPLLIVQLDDAIARGRG